VNDLETYRSYELVLLLRAHSAILTSPNNQEIKPMAQYLLSVWHDGDYPTVGPDVTEMLIAQVGAFNERLAAEGAFVFGAGLQPHDTATVFDGTTPDVKVSDGAFTDSQKQTGGFWIIQADDINQATTWAHEAAQACMGAVELRSFQVDAP
jgi:hypothetical protein